MSGSILDRIYEVRNSTFWPDADDLSLIALSLARIQFVYQLDVK